MHRGTGLRYPHCLKNYFNEGTVQIHTGYQCRTWFRNALLNLEIYEMCFWGRQESLDWQLFPTSELQKWPSILCTHRTGSLNCLKPEFETRTSGSLETGRSLAVRFPTAWWDWRHRTRIPQLSQDFPAVLGCFEPWAGPGTPANIYCPVSASQCAINAVCWDLHTEQRALYGSALINLIRNDNF